MDDFNFTGDYDIDVMNSPKAESFIQYMDDFQSDVAYFLRGKGFLYSFLYPYVEQYISSVQAYITRERFDVHEARIVSKKEVCADIDKACQELEEYGLLKLIEEG